MRTFAIAAAVLVLACGIAGATEPAAVDELKASVPALSAFHDVIYPLWHTAWPNKDVELMKELLPGVRSHVEKIQKAELPGILRDREAAWKAGVASLTAAAAAYEQALAGGEQQALLDAAELLHAEFEKLVRVVRPPMKELDAYHVLLYQVYHYAMPGRDVAKLRELAPQMVAACTTLQGGTLPKRAAGKAEAIKTAFTELCTATDAFAAAAATGEADAAVAAGERVHDAYQTAEHLFE